MAVDLEFPWLEAPRRVGRPKAPDTAARRRARRDVAMMMLESDIPVARIAAVFGVTRKTAYAWLDQVLADEGRDGREARAARDARSRR